MKEKIYRVGKEKIYIVGYEAGYEKKRVAVRNFTDIKKLFGNGNREFEIEEVEVIELAEDLGSVDVEAKLDYEECKKLLPEHT